MFTVEETYLLHTSTEVYRILFLLKRVKFSNLGLLYDS